MFTQNKKEYLKSEKARYEALKTVTILMDLVMNSSCPAVKCHSSHHEYAHWSQKHEN